MKITMTKFEMMVAVQFFLNSEVLQSEANVKVTGITVIGTGGVDLFELATEMRAASGGDALDNPE